MTSQSVIDAAYVRTQSDKASVQDFRRAMSVICSIIGVVAINDKDISRANQAAHPDYEDSARIACAERLSCEAIISTDKKFKAGMRKDVYTVSQYFGEIFNTRP